MPQALLLRNVLIKGQHFLEGDNKEFVTNLEEIKDVSLDDENAIVTLIPEPENQYDNLAIRAELQGHKIGYLQAEVTPVVLKAMKTSKVVFVITKFPANKLKNFQGVVVAEH